MTPNQMAADEELLSCNEHETPYMSVNSIRVKPRGVVWVFSIPLSVTVGSGFEPGFFSILTIGINFVRLFSIAG